MKINKLFKNITITAVLFGAMVLNGTTSSKAVLQSNGNTGATYNLNDWMVNVRKMEELGGAMGLSETLNSNLTSSSDSNNIDVHMQKNTEYGALAILSASNYGNSNIISSENTTTGNISGVVIQLNSEWTTGVKSNFNTYVSNRYKDIYEDNYVAKRGDAISETKGWHKSSISKWFSVYTSTGIVRCINGIFDYSAMYYTSSFGGNDETAKPTNKYHSRAVIVQGEGI